MKITLRSKKSHAPVTIINSYAPNTGFNEKEKEDRWTHMEETLKRTPGKHIIIWRAYANGQIGNIPAEEATPRKIIGNQAKNENAEPGNGKEIRKYDTNKTRYQ